MPAAASVGLGGFASTSISRGVEDGRFGQDKGERYRATCGRCCRHRPCTEASRAFCLITCAELCKLKGRGLRVRVVGAHIAHTQGAHRHKHTRTCKCTYTSAHAKSAHSHKRTHTRTHIRTHSALPLARARTHTYTHTRARIHTHTYTYTHTHTCVCTNTHKHMQTNNTHTMCVFVCTIYSFS